MPLTPEQVQECSKLKELFLAKAGMSQRQFVQKYDLGTPGNLNQYLQGRRAVNLPLALKMASALHVDIADFSPRLAKEYGPVHLDNNAEPVRLRMKKIPIVSEVQAGLMTSHGAPDIARTAIANGDFIYVDDETPDGSFAFRLRGDSMEPTFSEGDIVVIDPTIRPNPGDFVVAQRCDGADIESTFKKYRARGIDRDGRTVFELVPLNPDYPTLYSDREQCEVVGVMVEHRRRYRRRR